MDEQNIQPHEQSRPIEAETINRFDEDETNNTRINDPIIVASTDRLITRYRLTTGECEDRPTNATAIIVYDLIEPLLHRGHTFYNSPLLLRSLKEQRTGWYGTSRLNREFAPDSVKTSTR